MKDLLKVGEQLRAEQDESNLPQGRPESGRLCRVYEHVVGCLRHVCRGPTVHARANRGEGDGSDAQILRDRQAISEAGLQIGRIGLPRMAVGSYGMDNPARRELAGTSGHRMAGRQSSWQPCFPELPAFGK